MIFPVLARQAVFWLCSNSSAVANETSLNSFAFLYGTLPTAPPVAVYATMYNAHVDTVSCFVLIHHYSLYKYGKVASKGFTIVPQLVHAKDLPAIDVDCLKQNSSVIMTNKPGFHIVISDRDISQERIRILLGHL